MANSNRVFVSPGVYTSELDLTFVAQSVGVTTLGLVGETLKGPAFEPILISSWDDFTTYFGSSSPEKDGVGNPKYELPYFAKSYLSEANQLFVTRILGYTGYKQYNTFGISTEGGAQITNYSTSALTITTVTGITIPSNHVIISSFSNYTSISGTMQKAFSGMTGSTFYSNLSGKTAVSGTTGTTVVSYITGNTFNNGDYFTIGYVPTGLTSGLTGNTLVSPIGTLTDLNWNDVYYTGTTASITSTTGVYSYLFVYSASTSTFNVTRLLYSASYQYSINDPNFQFYPQLSGNTASNGTLLNNYILSNISGNTSTDSTWFTIGLVPSSYTSGLTTTLNVPSPVTSRNNASDYNGKEWYNIFCDLDLSGNIQSVSSYLFQYYLNSGNTNTPFYSVTRFQYPATINSAYDDIIVAALRPRGHYSSNVLKYEVTGSSFVSITSTSDLTKNPFADFVINVTGNTGGAKSLTVNLDQTSNKSITKVLGTDVYDRNYTDNPLYVFEFYPNFLLNAFEQGYIRGISTQVIYDTNNDSFLPNPNGDYGSYKAYDTPMSPTVVSEVRGGKVLDLFNIITISDGDSANEDIKITIQNINTDTGEFDLIVRDFNDSDSNQVLLEKFSRCSMNPDVPGYVALKVGTSDGQFPLLSKYIMLSMDPNAPSDAIPAGFRGFVRNSDFGSGNEKLGSVLYKTQYFTAGDTMYYDSTGAPITSSGDKVRNVTLGLSSSNGFNYDADLFKYKGWRSAGQTFGFHLSVNATGITQTGTTYQTTPYDFEGQTGTNNMLNTPANCKFTFAVCGGFDGWDIYRNTRTYGDAYILGKSTYNNNNINNGGIFNVTNGNSDYYSYYDGIQTFANPEAVDINVFATPGINFFDHSSLTNQAIEMIEVDRADSLYVISSPNESTADGVIGDIMDQEYDSNYSATYWPWIQVKDVDNATQIYIPPTGEVLRNIALTDNIAYPWYASAGYSRGLVNSIKAVKKLTSDERDNLYKNRINPIATFSDTGTIIWGNKTLQVRESALDRINVRRLLLRARKLISAVCVRLLFEQNDDQIRQEFLRLVNPILDAIKKERGLTDFRVTVSNDPADIDANTLRGKIYIKPTRSLEFIDVEFIITPTGASFENV